MDTRDARLSERRPRVEIPVYTLKGHTKLLAELSGSLDPLLRRAVVHFKYTAHIASSLRAASSVLLFNLLSSYCTQTYAMTLDAQYIS